MSSEQDNTAIVAIVIALIAFFVTTAQLLQALFGTAVGYRQCQPSVMGDWATKTRRKWRWSEFRFETIFTTPNIELNTPSVLGTRSRDGGVLITGSASSRRETLSAGGSESLVWPAKRKSGSETTSDLAGWLSLLNILHLSQQHFFELSTHENRQRMTHNHPGSVAGNLSCPAISFQTRSWDFMPPDIVRPFATSNVGDIIALAHRLGMRWKDIRPDDGVLRAEGNGQSITSTTVRGFGLLLQYTFDLIVLDRNADKRAQTWNIKSTLTIPSFAADMLGFQIVPGSRDLSLPDFVFDISAGFSPVRVAMNQLGLNRDVQDMYANFFHSSGHLYGFSDLIGMVAPFMPLPGSTVVQVFSAYPNIHDSPTNWWEGFVVYHARLLEFMEQLEKANHHSKQMKWVLDRFEYMRRTYPWNLCPSWEDEIANKEVKNGRSIDFLDDLRNTWSTTTSYFRNLEIRESPFRYIDLVGAHIAQAVYYPDLAEANIKAGTNKRYELGHLRSKRVAEGMHIYVDQIPKVVDFMKDKGVGNAMVVQEAWWTLILRAMCWHRSVAFVEILQGNLVPPSFHESRIPVYIA